jgi:pyruvate/2-oxoglutarate dehydrogenase complex dihydrolipoamide dehydrogenase (E3) component
MITGNGATEKADVIVVGMGPGGEDVAGNLAMAGLRVVGIERALVGGECPYWGCVPSKMMIRAANLLADARRVSGIAGAAEVRPDWAPVARRIRQEATDNWNDKVAVDRFVNKGGEFVRGSGRLLGPDRVVAADREFVATRGIVLNVGTSPVIPPIPGLADVPYWTNRQAVEVETLPGSLIVLGGGAIGLELAQVFTRFGVRVSVLEAMPNLLPMEEPEAGSLLMKILESEGVDVRTGLRAVAVEKQGGEIAITLESGESVVAERLLVAVGRRANLTDLGLEQAAVVVNKGFIRVDEHMRAGSGIWAIGDATGHGAFTHVSMYQARIATADILRQAHAPADYKALPRVTFTDPEVGAAGLTEKQARDQGMAVRTGIGDQASSARGWIHKVGNQGFIKLVEDADRGVLVGATAMSPVGGEILSMLTLAIHAQVPTSELRNMMYAYPTFHRGMEDALAALERSQNSAPKQAATTRVA